MAICRKCWNHSAFPQVETPCGPSLHEELFWPRTHWQKRTNHRDVVARLPDLWLAGALPQRIHGIYRGTITSKERSRLERIHQRIEGHWERTSPTFEE